MFYSSDSTPAPVSHDTGLSGENMWIRKGETFQAPEQALYLLHSGAIHLEAMTDGSGCQVVGTLLPGDPVGILAKYLAGVRFCYRAMEDCVLQKLSDNFLQETEENPLAATVFRALSSATLRIILSHSGIDISRDYPRIREQIYRYMAKKQAGSLEEEKLLPFVTSQEMLPRELVSRVLSDLTERAYLDIRRGKLNAINFPLPLEFRTHQSVSATRMPGSFPPCPDNHDAYYAVAV